MLRLLSGMLLVAVRWLAWLRYRVKVVGLEKLQICDGRPW